MRTFKQLKEQINSKHDPERPAFEIALSPLAEAALEVGGMAAFKKLKKIAEDTVLVIIQDDKKREQSLVPVPSPGRRKLVRGYPVDIRGGGPDGPVILKTITYWNQDSGHYRILLELPGETWIESCNPQEGSN